MKRGMHDLWSYRHAKHLMSISHHALAPTLSPSDGQMMMNFFTVITLYPAVTMVYEYYMNDAGDEKACCKSTCHCLKSEKGYTRASGKKKKH